MTYVYTVEKYVDHSSVPYTKLSLDKQCDTLVSEHDSPSEIQLQRQDRASALAFCDPGLHSISKLYSCKAKAQQ